MDLIEILLFVIRVSYLFYIKNNFNKIPRKEKIRKNTSKPFFKDTEICEIHQIKRITRFPSL